MYPTELKSYTTTAILLSLILITYTTAREKIGEETCVFVDHVERELRYGDIPCSSNKACTDTHYNITYINLIPYVYSLNESYWGIDEILLKCCGPCVKYTTRILNNITGIK